MGSNFKDIEYLKNGTDRQKKVYKIMEKLKLFENLKAYKPVLAGTVPLNIDTQDSDLDIICEFHDHGRFSNDLLRYFSHYSNFHQKEKYIRGIKTVIASFSYDNEVIEIFGQWVPVENQYAYRHMIVESRLLKLGGEKAYREIKRLKKMGYKTEPAFAHYFGIKGDYYKILYELFGVSHEKLKEKIRGR